MTSLHIGALDIGGTKMAATIANEQGLLARVTEPTVKAGRPEAVGEQAIQLLTLACAKSGVDIKTLTSVGVSSCGPFVNIDGMTALAAPNICGGVNPQLSDLSNDWKSIPLEKILRTKFAQVIIKNDCTAGLIAERTFGSLDNEPNCVYVTWSTGIGFGLCVDGHVLQGKYGNAGHAGHMLMDLQSLAQCGCGNVGDVEALVSGRGLQQQFGVAPANFFTSTINNASLNSDALMTTAQWFGRALYNIAVTLDTRIFAIGGSVWLHHSEWLLPIVKHEILTRLSALTHDVSIISASLGTLATDIGGLTLVMPAAWIENWKITKPWEKLIN